MVIFYVRRVAMNLIPSLDYEVVLPAVTFKMKFSTGLPPQPSKNSSRRAEMIFVASQIRDRHTKGGVPGRGIAKDLKMISGVKPLSKLSPVSGSLSIGVYETRRLSHEGYWSRIREAYLMSALQCWLGICGRAPCSTCSAKPATGSAS